MNLYILLVLNFKIDYNYVPFFPRETHQYLMTTKLCSASLHEPEVLFGLLKWKFMQTKHAYLNFILVL